MGNRLTKIYTKTGDRGMTGLADGSRVLKDDPICDAMGNVDELNSVIGMILTQTLPEEPRALLLTTQHTLFEVGGALALPDYEPKLDTAALEQAIDKLNEPLPPLKEFVLPNGTLATSYCHLARSVCRRAERSIVTIAEEDNDTHKQILAYINRLSDYLFVLARTVNTTTETLWDHTKKQ